jgi:hypothetical protein
MLRKSVLVVLSILLLGPALSALAGFDPTLAVYWPLDEGKGTVATDATGKGINGTISAGPTWVTAGKIGGALNFTGTGDVRGPHVPMDSRSFTIAMWVNPRLPASGSQIVFSEQVSGANSVSMHLRIGGPASTDSGGVNNIRFGFYNDDVDSPANVLQSNTWYHLTFWYDAPSKNQRIYINGVQVAMRTATNHFLATSGVICLGSWTGGSNYTGMVDDFLIYQKALSVAEIQSIMKGLSDKSLAGVVSPADAATDVPRDATLNWTAGQYPATHDVYFGTTAADVNNATRTNTTGILASKGQADTTFDPAGVFAYGQTYYWRIDEVNKSADGTIYKGTVWSFTAEPYGYPVKPVSATASSSQPGMGPEKTIDGSGLTGDLHGTDLTTMWLSSATGPVPAWIQYQFDKVYKFYDLKVWNSNQLIESILGFGPKKVTIDYSVDGTTWVKVSNVPEFAKAPSAAGYAANTTVSLAGIQAKYVKLTIDATWGGGLLASLSEVRFSYVPVLARAPQPANAATGVKVDATLDWRPGREAGSHKVFLGTDQAAVAGGTAPATTVANHGFAPASLNLATTYYWKVDEVNTVTYPGDVWSFTTADYAVVDDFESYNDDLKAQTAVFNAWVDGFDNPAKNGAVVGLNLATNGTFCDTTTFHAGKQSMPLAYDNTKAPLSEATRTFAPAQDWTTAGVKTLVLFFYGDPANTGTQLYIKVNDTKIVYPGNASNLARRRWNQWNVDLAGVPAATLRSVKTLTIGITGGAGKLLIDDILLYRLAPEIPVAVNPGTTGLVAYYAMTNNVQDGSGNGNHGTVVGTPTYASGLAAFGTALNLNGTTACVNLGNKPVFNFAGSFSLSVWANIGAWTSNWNHVMVGNRGESGIGWQLRRRDSNKICFTTRGVGQDDTGSTMDAPLGEWVHIAAVYDNAGNTKRIYVNGVQDALVTTTAGKVATTTHNTYIGARANSGNTGVEGLFTGLLDDIRIYSRALSAGEVEFLSNPTP